MSDGLPPRCSARKARNCDDVAPIGLDGLRRHAPFVAEMGEPARQLGRTSIGREGEVGDRAGLWPFARISACHLAYNRTAFVRHSLTRGPSQLPWPDASSTCWCRSRSIRPIRTACRRTWSSRPAISCAVPLGPREATGVVWGDGVAQARPRQPPQGHRREARSPAAEGRAAALRRLGLRLHAEPARHGAAHVPAHGRAPGRGARAPRRAARRPAAAAHDGSASPRARSPGRRPAARKVRGRRGGRRQRGVIDGLVDEGTLRSRGAAAGAGRDRARSRISARPTSRRRNAPRRMRCGETVTGRLLGHADRRRHRLGQDRSLLRGGGRDDPARPPDADPDAGDRAHGAVPRPLRRSASASAGRMALAAHAAPARPHLAAVAEGDDQGGGRRPLGAVPALCGSRPDRGR